MQVEPGFKSIFSDDGYDWSFPKERRMAESISDNVFSTSTTSLVLATGSKESEFASRHLARYLAIELNHILQTCTVDWFLWSRECVIQPQNAVDKIRGNVYAAVKKYVLHADKANTRHNGEYAHCISETMLLGVFIIPSLEPDPDQRAADPVHMIMYGVGDSVALIFRRAKNTGFWVLHEATWPTKTSDGRSIANISTKKIPTISSTLTDKNNNNQPIDGERFGDFIVQRNDIVLLASRGYVDTVPNSVTTLLINFLMKTLFFKGAVENVNPTPIMMYAKDAFLRYINPLKSFDQTKKPDTGAAQSKKIELAEWLKSLTSLTTNQKILVNDLQREIEADLGLSSEQTHPEYQAFELTEEQEQLLKTIKRSPVEIESIDCSAVPHIPSAYYKHKLIDEIFKTLRETCQEKDATHSWYQTADVNEDYASIDPANMLNLCVNEVIKKYFCFDEWGSYFAQHEFTGQYISEYLGWFAKNVAAANHKKRDITLAAGIIGDVTYGTQPNRGLRYADMFKIKLKFDLDRAMLDLGLDVQYVKENPKDF